MDAGSLIPVHTGISGYSQLEIIGGVAISRPLEKKKQQQELAIMLRYSHKWIRNAFWRKGSDIHL